MKAVTVLMYHAIVDGEMEGADSHYSVPPATFARQLQLICAHGRRICSVHQLLYEGLPASGEPWPVCLTFDDGHLTNAAAAEAIAREEGRAEFFVNPSMVGKPGFLDWPALREMAAMGMAIQSHGMNHRYLDQLSPAEVRAELANSKAAIEDAIGSLVDAKVDILTITQYMRPSKLHHPIDRWVKPQEFVALAKMAEEMGIAAVMSGPMVRSSYRSGTLWGRAMRAKGRPIPENMTELAAPVTARQEASAVVARLK